MVSTSGLWDYRWFLCIPQRFHIFRGFYKEYYTTCIIKSATFQNYMVVSNSSLDVHY